MLSVKVTKRQLEADDIVSFELVDPDSRELPAFAAGAHIDVVLASGRVRQYSLCNAPGESHRYLIAVLRESNGRGGSIWMHDVVQEGELIQISSPRNLFPLAVEARSSVLIAGGIGVTPILAMAEQLNRQNADFELHYCARNWTRMAFADRIRNSNYASHVRFHVGTSNSPSGFQASSVLGPPDSGRHLYVCGPTGFMDCVLTAARQGGWAETNLHREYFSAAATAHPAGSFEVELAKSGQVFQIPPQKSVVEVLSEHGIELPVSCEQGVCGTCLTRVLSGDPDHRDMFMTDEEHARNDQFTPCCSRSKTARLVLDL